MTIDPTVVTLRPGNNRQYLNIDYDDTEIGHLKFETDGRLVEVRAIHYENRPLVNLIARCHHAFEHSLTTRDAT